MTALQKLCIHAHTVSARMLDCILDFATTQPGQESVTIDIHAIDEVYEEHYIVTALLGSKCRATVSVFDWSDKQSLSNVIQERQNEIIGGQQRKSVIIGTRFIRAEYRADKMT